MKKIVVEKGYFRNVEALGCSYYGNPRYSAELVLPDGTSLWGKTATNSSSAYGIRNYESYQAQVYKEIDGETWYKTEERIPRFAEVTYHITRNGNIIFDYVTDAVEVR